MARVLLMMGMLLVSTTIWAGNSTCIPLLHEAVDVVTALTKVLNKSNEVVADAVIEAQNFNDQLPDAIEEVKSLHRDIMHAISLGNLITITSLSSLITVVIGSVVVWGGRYGLNRMGWLIPDNAPNNAPNNAPAGGNNS